MMFDTKIRIVFSLVCLCLALTVGAYDYDPNDFAIEVIDYDEGTGADIDWIDGTAFDDPCTALGRPTIDTTGDNWNIPVPVNVPLVIVYSAFRSFEVVTVGHGGQLILKFNHPVRDDVQNPYGIDFIVFGNAQQNCGQYWTNGNPEDFVVTGSSLIAEAGFVSVSQDGVSWYRYDNSPYADTFAPTLGRVYDPNNPDTSIGQWNLWWAEPTEPVLPLDPSLTVADMVGMTVAEAAQVYGHSAGGGGFDLAESGMDWIEYVRIEGNEEVTPEIDAVADVACCGDYKHPFPVGDINTDCKVGYEDLASLCQYWLAEISGPNDPAKTADVYEDDIVNLQDWALIAENWQECSWQCQ
ncbi:MAG: dockerin type I domain-containing protein [Planctomycetota bacterium]